MVGNPNNPAQPPRAPSAPSAPGIRSTVGTSQQNRNNSFRSRPNSGGVKPNAGGNRPRPNGGGVKPGDKGKPGRFGNNRPTPLDKQRERERRQREKERREQERAANQNRPPVTGTPQYEQIDPRDDQYWENVTALENTFALDTQALNLEQQQADTEFSLYDAQQQEYNLRRQQALAMSRLGRGLRSGGFREARTLNDIDFQYEAGRRQRDKQNADFERNLRREGLAERLQQDKQLALREGADRQMQAMLDESETSAGDRQNLEPQFAAEDTRKAIRQTTSRIKKLRERQKNAGPNEKAKLEKQIKKLQRRRTKMQGRL